MPPLRNDYVHLKEVANFLSVIASPFVILPPCGKMRRPSIIPPQFAIRRQAGRRTRTRMGRENRIQRFACPSASGRPGIYERICLPWLFTHGVLALLHGP